MGTGSPPKKIIDKKITFGLKLNVCAPITLLLVEFPHDTFLDHVLRRKGDMWVPFLVGQPLEFGRAKKRPNFGDFDREYL